MEIVEETIEGLKEVLGTINKRINVVEQWIYKYDMVTNNIDSYYPEYNQELHLLEAYAGLLARRLQKFERGINYEKDNKHTLGR